MKRAAARLRRQADDQAVRQGAADRAAELAHLAEVRTAEAEEYFLALEWAA